MVVMNTKQEKEDILVNLKLLKGTVEEFGKISVTDDYISHESEQIKSWVKIAAEKSEEDSDKVYKVRGDPKNKVTPGFNRQARTKRQLSSSSSSSNIFFNIDGLKATRLSGHSKIDGVLPLSTFARVHVCIIK